jgi:outer membrane protein TolC
VQRSDTEQAALEHRLVRQERRLAVASAWVELWAAQEASRLAHEEEANTRELLARLERASTSGGSTRVELATARAFAAELAALHLEWEGRRVDAAAVVAQLLGAPTLVEASGALPAGEGDVTRLTAPKQLSVTLAQREVDGERARLDESVAQWGTQLQVSLLGGHEAPAQWFAGVGLGVTLPLLEQGRRERTQHLAAVAKLSGARSLEERRASVRLQVLAHELEHTAETLRVVAEEQLPAAEDAVALETKRFMQGEATLLELTLLRRQAVSARIAAALARARYAGARARARELEAQP